jgi:type I restriction enzyme S subunit
MSSHLPQGWELKSVGELSNVKRGASPRPIKDAKWWGGNTGWVRISDVTSSRKYLKKTTQYLSDEGVTKSVKIDKGEVVLTICATIGRAIIISVDACIHDGFVWFDKLGESINREFWYYFLASKEDFFKAQRQSGTQGNLNTSIVSDVLCMLPPLPEQQKIAKILTSVDEVIEKTQAQIDKLKDLKTGIMQELLTNGIGHTEFKDSPVGRIPAEWEVKELNQLVSIKHGYAFEGQYFTTSPSKYILLTPGNFNRDGRLYFGAKTKYYTGDIPDGYVLKNGDVLVVMTDLTKEMAILGNTITLQSPQTVLHNQRIGKVEIVSENKLTQEYLCFVMNSDRIKTHVKDTATGTTVKHSSPSKILEPFIPIPPLEEQQKITSIFDSINLKLSIVENKLQKLKNTKKALMQDLLTGNVRVKVDS